MHFNVKDGDDITTFLQTICIMNSIKLLDVEERFSLLVIHCEDGESTPAEISTMAEQVLSKKGNVSSITYYDDNLGKRITIV